MFLYVITALFLIAFFLFLFFFFFQAEDGIRDWSVTGVQTCALPICRGFAKADLGEVHHNVPGGDEDHPLIGQIMGSEPAEMAAAAFKMLEQIGRASCRERV